MKGLLLLRDKESATQVGFFLLAVRACQHSGSLAHRFDKPAMHAALLMSQQCMVVTTQQVRASSVRLVNPLVT